MLEKSVHTIINQQNGNLAFKISQFESNSNFDHLQRNNYYTLIWVTKGNGILKADFSEYSFDEDSLFAFYPYQPFMLSENQKLEGIEINFHPDFFVFTDTIKKWLVTEFYLTTFINHHLFM